MPITTAFLLAATLAMVLFRGQPFKERLETFSKGAGNYNIMLMVWIFVMAGAFASTAKAMGAIDATVHMVLAILPAGWLLPGLFLASCVISMSIGTSVGTIVALTPIAVGVSSPDTLTLYAAAVVGGSFFGDNLSFISDTTIMATRTQGIEMREKFLANMWFAFPAAAITIFIYICLADTTATATTVSTISVGNMVLALPYIFVLVTAMCGLSVLKALTAGLLLSVCIGVCTGTLTYSTLCNAIAEGIDGMAALILVTMLAGGIVALIRQHLSNRQAAFRQHTALHIGPRTAQLSLAALVMAVDAITANNTVAILTVGDFARKVSERYGISPRRTACILDTFSCVAQGLIPWGAQILMAAGLSESSPTAIVPYLYYPMVLCVVTITGIIFTLSGSRSGLRT